MKRTIGFIDGFNLYHALVRKNSQGEMPYGKYRWLNYRKLIQEYLEPQDELKEVYYFTAIYPGDIARKGRHNGFIRIQMDLGVNVVRGRFREVDRFCRLCNQIYKAHEEKRTDVNIAVNMVRLAYEDAYDKAILISADSDLVPVLDTIKLAKPGITSLVVLPIGFSGIALSHSASFTLFMKENDLRNCLLADPYITKNGTPISCPLTWV
jgi:uncharacterized LabA/DUF88 family protein